MHHEIRRFPGNNTKLQPPEIIVKFTRTRPRIRRLLPLLTLAALGLVQDGSTRADTVTATVLQDAPTTLNVNYSGGAWATMNGVDSSDASARGSAGRVAPRRI